MVRARRNLRPPPTTPKTTTQRFFSRRPRAAIGETELKREEGASEGGRPQGGPRKGNFGECGPAAAVNRHEPIIRDAARVARLAGPEFLQRYR